MLIKDFEHKVQSNKNIHFVNVKSDRICVHCGKTIYKKEKCLTTNTYRTGRKWQCLACTRQQIQQYSYKNICSTFAEIKSVQAKINTTPFDDDGAVLAYNDMLNELTAKCLACNRCKFANSLMEV